MLTIPVSVNMEDKHKLQCQFTFVLAKSLETFGERNAPKGFMSWDDTADKHNYKDENYLVGPLETCK
jgi:hypothetical protein